jgi:hypothetical protein
MTSPQPSPPAATWRTSTYSTGGNQCVEVARTTTACAVRDSKNPAGGHLTFDTATWNTFLTAVKQGRHDH